MSASRKASRNHTILLGFPHPEPFDCGPYDRMMGRLNMIKGPDDALKALICTAELAFRGGFLEFEEWATGDYWLRLRDRIHRCEHLANMYWLDLLRVCGVNKSRAEWKTLVLSWEALPIPRCIVNDKLPAGAPRHWVQAFDECHRFYHTPTRLRQRAAYLQRLRRFTASGGTRGVRREAQSKKKR